MTESQNATFLTLVDSYAVEIYFDGQAHGRAFDPFSVTTPGWVEVKMLRQYDGGWAGESRCLVRTEKITWSRDIEIMRWTEVDPANLIPLRRADKREAGFVATHRSHELEYSGVGEDTDSCGVSVRYMEGLGDVYRVER